jgi:nucleoid DNA-binding protein
MTQTQMTAYLADKIGITKRQAKSARRTQRLGHQTAQERGFTAAGGSWGIPQAQAQGACGPRPCYGEQIKIPARTRLRFTPAKALKDSVLGAR